MSGASHQIPGSQGRNANPEGSAGGGPANIGGNQTISSKASARPWFVPSDLAAHKASVDRDPTIRKEWY